jgi:DNA-binding NarL/FixJ family response regulator
MLLEYTGHGESPGAGAAERFRYRNAHRPVVDSTVVVLRSSHIGWVALRTAIENNSNMRLVADVAMHERAVECVALYHPCLLIAAEESLPTPITSAMSEYQAVAPTTRLVIISDSLDRQTTSSIADHGASAVLLWRSLTSYDDLCACLAAILTGGICILSNELLHHLLGPSHEDIEECMASLRLTSRERAILQNLTDGMTEREAAIRERIGLRTVEEAAQRIKRKLGASTLRDAIIRARTIGLVKTHE